jgi:hypothetical protein
MAAGREVRVLALSGIAALLDWAADEGWNPGLHDAAAFAAADPEGFLGLYVQGEMVAGISAVAYGPAYGFIGLYICRRDMRGRGYGRSVWDAGLARVGPRTIGLDGVPEQQANYGRMGFEPAYRTIRYGGRPTALLTPSELTRPVSGDLRAGVLALDREGFPGPRAGFLDRWLAPPHIARALVREGAVRGYGVARPCRVGWKIGPIFAADDADARDLFTALAAEVGPEPLQVDVPEPQAGFATFLRTAGLEPGFVTSRMYLGPRPATTPERVFAVTTLELG